LVTSPDLLSVRSTADALQILKKMKIDPNKVMLIVNTNFKEHPLKRESIVSIIGQYNIAEIPYDNSTVIQAMQTGVPLLMTTPKSEISLAISELAYRLSSNVMENQGKDITSPFLDKIKKLVS
jgi:MinD-like ATPase involved in chromosome partitioning or flagellar assembly